MPLDGLVLLFVMHDVLCCSDSDEDLPVTAPSATVNPNTVQTVLAEMNNQLCPHLQCVLVNK